LRNPGSIGCNAVTFKLLFIFMKLLEYIKKDGSNPYKKWFDILNAQAAAKITVAKARIELGNSSNHEHH